MTRLFQPAEWSVDAQWRWRNAKAWTATLAVLVILISGAVWLQGWTNRLDADRCRDSGGTPVEVRRWVPVVSKNRTGEWRTVVECRTAP